MADNRAVETKTSIGLSVAASSPASPASGDPVRFGVTTGVAMTAKGAGGNTSTLTSVDFGEGVYFCTIHGVDDNGNSAVSAGDSLYFVDGDAFLSKKSSGYFFGIALEAVGSGLSATRKKVLHILTASGTVLGSGAVGATQLATSAVTTPKIAANAVTAPKLSTTLGTGTIHFPIQNALVISTNDIANTAHVSKNTDPILERINAATDKGLRLSWASASVLELQMGSFNYPQDLDDTAAITIHILAAMKAASVDTPVIAVSYFEGVGDTNAGGNTGALSTTIQDLTVVIAAGDVGPGPTFASIGIKPGTHGTSSNDVYVYAVWAEYTRK